MWPVGRVVWREGKGGAGAGGEGGCGRRGGQRRGLKLLTRVLTVFDDKTQCTADAPDAWFRRVSTGPASPCEMPSVAAYPLSATHKNIFHIEYVSMCPERHAAVQRQTCAHAPQQALPLASMLATLSSAKVFVEVVPVMVREVLGARGVSAAPHRSTGSRFHPDHASCLQYSIASTLPRTQVKE